MVKLKYIVIDSSVKGDYEMGNKQYTQDGRPIISVYGHDGRYDVTTPKGKYPNLTKDGVLAMASSLKSSNPRIDPTGRIPFKKDLRAAARLGP